MEADYAPDTLGNLLKWNYSCTRAKVRVHSEESAEFPMNLNLAISNLEFASNIVVGNQSFLN